MFCRVVSPQSHRDCTEIQRSMFRLHRGKSLMIRKQSILILFFTIMCFGGPSSSPQNLVTRHEILSTESPITETKADRDARMKWWREARFGMFIHWGLYAVPAGEYKGQRSTRIGEWIMEWANIPVVEYEKFAAQFNPVRFNAAEWVEIAKSAGMKYIVITSKHHDGFSMFNSQI